MRDFWAQRWKNYVGNIDWFDLAYVQCRPVNLLKIFAGITAVLVALLYTGLLSNLADFWIALGLGAAAIGCDLLCWFLRKRMDNLTSVVPTLAGVESICYSSCIAYAALCVEPPFCYGLWGVYLATLIYWAIIQGFSALFALSCLGAPVALMIAMGTSPYELIAIGFGGVLFAVISKNTGYRKTEESKKLRMRQAFQELECIFERMDGRSSRKSNTFNLSDVAASIGRIGNIRFAAPPPDAKVCGEKECLVFVCSSLVDNAIDAKATQIEILFVDMGSKIFVLVTDNGRGIPYEDQPKIFSPFLMSEGKDSLGIGLFLSRRMMKACGGDLKLLSSGKHGTTMSIELAKV